jgi:hypothetical protein
VEVVEMSKTMCPGQDTRYWRPGDIFEVPCGNCGRMIEFFKDEASRRCKCGNRVQNPKLSRGCAQWCEHAKECLGYDPKSVDAFADNPVYDVSLTDRLIDALRIEVGEKSDLYKNARRALDRARDLLESSDGNPRIIIPATMLMEVDIPATGNGEEGTSDKGVDGLPVAKRIMREVELDSVTIDDVCEIIERYQRGEYIESPEFKIVSDSRPLESSTS